MPSIPVGPMGFEKRIHTRFDKAFIVVIGSELYGDSIAVGRNISGGGLLVEMSYARADLADLRARVDERSIHAAAEHWLTHGSSARSCGS